MLRILRSADYPTRPWKNGGDTAISRVVPPGASLDDFDWRLSLAQVDRDGPFSRFDNVDRTLVLLRKLRAPAARPKARPRVRRPPQETNVQHAA